MTNPTEHRYATIDPVIVAIQTDAMARESYEHLASCRECRALNRALAERELRRTREPLGITDGEARRLADSYFPSLAPVAGFGNRTT